MSDYVENQEYSMQLAAPGDDPFEYDWARLQEEVDQPMPGLFDDITSASLQEDIDVDAGDWSTLNDALENGPLRDFFHSTAGDQSAEAHPGDRLLRLANPQASPMYQSDKTTSAFVCDHPNCGSKAFNHKGDLNRHKKKHTGQREFACTAQGCKYSFTRNDKLLDHTRAGHDHETLFVCPECQALLTRDVLPLHGSFSILFRCLDSYRQCPLPKCSFRVSIRKLDELQPHLLEKHDAKGRKRFASFLMDRGYDHDSASIVCPKCPNEYLFSTHSEFKKHLVNNHCGHYTVSDEWTQGAWHYATSDGKRTYESVLQELREHRRTILSLWPGFSGHDFVWDDIKCKA